MNKFDIEMKTELVLTMESLFPDYPVPAGTTFGQLIGVIDSKIVNMNPSILEGVFMFNSLEGELIAANKIDLGEQFAEQCRQTHGMNVWGYHIVAIPNPHKQGEMTITFVPTMFNVIEDYGDRWALRASYKILLNEASKMLDVSNERAKIESPIATK